MVGSNEKVKVEFYSANDDLAGVVTLSLTSTPQYSLTLCKLLTNFPTALPSETDKIWRITLTRTSGVRLVIHCNNKEVLNEVLSGITCSKIYETAWSTYWARDVEKIRFPSGNNVASDFYRPGKQLVH